MKWRGKQGLVRFGSAIAAGAVFAVAMGASATTHLPPQPPKTPVVAPILMADCNPPAALVGRRRIRFARMQDLGVLSKNEESVSAVGRTRLITRTAAGALVLWNAETGARMAEMSGPGGDFYREVGASDDGSLFHFGRDAEPIELWDVEHGRRIAVFANVLGASSGASGEVEHSPEGARIAVAERDGQAGLYDARTGEKIADLTAPERLRRLSFLLGGRRLLGQLDHDAMLWDAQNGALMARLGSPAIEKLARGTRLLAHRGSGWSLWDPQSGRKLAGDEDDEADPLIRQYWKQRDLFVVSHYNDEDEGEVGEEGEFIWDARAARPILRVGSYATRSYLSPDGRALVAHDKDGQAVLWRLQEGAEPVALGRFYADADLEWVGDDDEAYPVVRRSRVPLPTQFLFSPDGARLATRNRADELDIWDVRRGARIARIGVTGESVRLRFSPRGAWLVVMEAARPAILWNAKTGRRHTDLGIHETSPDFVFAFKERRLIVRSGAGGPALWDLDRAAKLVEFLPTTPSFEPLVSPDERRLLVQEADADEERLALWDVVRGQRLAVVGHARDQAEFAINNGVVQLIVTHSPYPYTGLQRSVFDSRDGRRVGICANADQSVLIETPKGPRLTLRTPDGHVWLYSATAHVSAEAKRESRPR